MNVTYGIEIDDDKDRYMTVAEFALDGMAKAAHPGAFLVDIFPICAYGPFLSVIALSGISFAWQ
jgi:hypothetical protein